MSLTPVNRPPTRNTAVESDLPLQAATDRGAGISGDQTLKISEFALLDGLLVWIIGASIYALNQRLHFLQFGPSAPLTVSRLCGLLLAFASIVILALQSRHLYRAEAAAGFHDQTLAVLRCALFSSLLITFITSLTEPQFDLWAIETSIAICIFLPGWRRLRSHSRNRRLARGVGFRNGLVIGAGQLGRTFAEYISSHPELGLSIAGFLDDEESGDPILGGIADLDRVIHERFIDEVFISSRLEAESFHYIASHSYRKRIDCKLLSEIHPGTNARNATKFVGDFAVLELYSDPLTSSGSLLKRLIDLVGASLALLITAPLWLVIAIAIRIEGDGPLLYCANRIGKKGKPFTCLKFRTMVCNADALKNDLLHLNERQGALFKIKKDPRVTRIGNLLRKTSLDELPQFWNVLLGDMSLVGPRPPDLFDYNRYDYHHLRRLDVTPGITGLWQVYARNDPSFDTMMQLDLRYIENWSLSLDLKIMLLTLPALVNGD